MGEGGGDVYQYHHYHDKHMVTFHDIHNFYASD